MKYDLAKMNDTEKRALWEKLKKTPEVASQVVAFSKAFGKITLVLEDE